MELILKLIPIVFWGTMLVLLIYVGIRRYKISKTETFDDREN